MNLIELRKILENFNEDKIEFDEPHISLRCEENNIKKKQIIHFILYETRRLSNFIEDRQNVYKLYFKLSRRKQLKLIVDIINPDKLLVRTVKVLDSKLYKNIRFIKRRRY